MPRVVPSQIVEFIDEEFPFARTRQPSTLSHTDIDALSALLRLTEELPDELRTVSGRKYSYFLRGIEIIRGTVTNRVAFSSHAPLDERLRNAIADVRAILEPLPDQQLPVATVGLAFISDAPLRESIRADIAFADQAFAGGEWKATTVLAGAVAEALLRWAITDKKTEAEVKAAARSAAISNPSSDADSWGFDAYIKVAANLNLIKQNTAEQATLAKDFRNLIHPGRSARLKEVCDRGTAHSALAAVEFIVRDLS
jgi:hypothetical protein